jgi:tryptophanyl-tRNA synthetase
MFYYVTIRTEGYDDEKRIAYQKPVEHSYKKALCEECKKSLMRRVNKDLRALKKTYEGVEGVTFYIIDRGEEMVDILMTIDDKTRIKTQYRVKESLIR